MSCGVGGRRRSDSALLWLWCRLAATAPIPPLAWEPPYAAGVALKKKTDKDKENKLKSSSLSNPKLYLSLIIFVSFKKNVIEVSLIYNIVLVSGIQQSHSAI